MPRYQKGTQGKLSVQDWDIITSYDDEPLLYILTRQQAASLLGMCDFLHWLTRWKNPPGQDEIDEFAAETEFNLMNPITCAMLTECLQPLFDAMTSQLDIIGTAQGEIEDILGNNTGVIPPGIEVSTAGNICSGASFVVGFMDSEIRRVYEEAENGLLDNLIEAAVEIIRAIPVIESLPLDEMINAVNIMFENQVADYITDYDTIYDDLVGSLACFIEGNGDVFDIEIWARWLEFIDTEYPTNRAAMLFSAFSPLRQSLVNDILAGIFNRPTLSQWFNLIMLEYQAGVQDSIACPTYTCPTAVCVTPVILLTAWSGFDDPPQGENVTDEGSCYYEVTTTEAETPGVFVMAIEAFDSGTWTIEDITYPDGISTGQIQYQKNGADFQPGGTPSIIEGIKYFGIGMTAPVPSPRVKFKATRLG